MTIWDGQGNSIESGDMFPLCEVLVSASVEVIAQDTAVDCTASTGRAWERKTMGEDE